MGRTEREIDPLVRIGGLAGNLAAQAAVSSGTFPGPTNGVGVSERGPLEANDQATERATSTSDHGDENAIGQDVAAPQQHEAPQTEVATDELSPLEVPVSPVVPAAAGEARVSAVHASPAGVARLPAVPGGPAPADSALSTRSARPTTSLSYRPALTPAPAPAPSPAIPHIDSPRAELASTQLVITAVDEATRSAQVDFLRDLEMKLAAIDAAVLGQHASVDEAAAAEIASIHATYEGARAKISAETLAQCEDVQLAYASEKSRLDGWRADADVRAETEVAMRQARARDTAAEYGGEAATEADQAATGLELDLSAASERARSSGSAGTGSAAVKQAKTAVSDRISSDTAAQIESQGPAVAASIRAEGAETVQAFEQRGAEAAADIGAQLPAITTSLEHGVAQSSAILDGGAASVVAALDESDRSLGESLVAEEGALAAEIQLGVTEKREEISLAGEQAKAALLTEANNLLAASAEAVSDAASQIADAEVPEEDANSIGAEARMRIREGFADAAQPFDCGRDSMIAAIEQDGTSSTAALAGIGPEVARHAETTVGETQSRVSQIAGRATEQFAVTVDQTRLSGDALIDGASQGLDAHVEAVDSSLAQGMETVRDELHGHADDATAAARESGSQVAPTISVGQARVDSRATIHPASFVDHVVNWFEEQWNDLVAMMSDRGFWAGLVVTVGLTALAYAFLGPFAVLVLPLIGALAAGASTLTNNLLDSNKKWDDGLWDSMLTGLVVGAVFAVAIGAGIIAGVGALGLLAIVEAVTIVTTIGANIYHGERPTKGLLANMLVAWLFQRLLGRGRMGRRPPGSEETPPRSNGPVPGGLPPALTELFPRLSTTAQRGFVQMQRVMSSENFMRFAERAKNSDGSYNVERANEIFEKAVMSDEDFNKRFGRDVAEFTARAEESVRKINNTCDAADGTSRPKARVGDGSSEAALREEIRTGRPVAGREHALKVTETIRSLRNELLELEKCKQVIPEEQHSPKIDQAARRAIERIEKMEPALDEWNARSALHPEIWNPDGTSRTVPGWPGRGGQDTRNEDATGEGPSPEE